MSHYRGPLNQVVGHRLIPGRRGGVYWQLTLACGHTIRRRIRRDRARLEAGEDLAPSLERARCRQCYHEAWERAVAALPTE